MRQYLASRVACLAVSVCAATCGGSSGSAPTAPSTPAPTTSAATVVIGNFTINYEAGVSSGDRTVVENGVRDGQAYFQSRFDRAITSPVTVDIRAGTGAFVAQALGYLITIYTGDTRWSGISLASRHRTVVHEAFHVLQTETGWADDPNRWLREGAAEYVGYGAAIAAGLTTYENLRNCEIQIYINGGGTATPRLEEITFALVSPVNSRYAIAWLAVDRLAGGLSGTRVLKGMWERSGTWEQRFEQTFGKPVTVFYDEFAAYRDSLMSPGSNACALV